MAITREVREIRIAETAIERSRRRWPVRFGSACTPSAPVVTGGGSPTGLFSRSDTAPSRRLAQGTDSSRTFQRPTATSGQQPMFMDIVGVLFKYVAPPEDEPDAPSPFRFSEPGTLSKALEGAGDSSRSQELTRPAPDVLIPTAPI